LIPNIDKFNEVEEKIYTNFLSNFCFKDGAHIKQQIENAEKFENEIAVSQTENFSQENNSLNNINSNNWLGINNIQNNNNKNEVLQRKKTRNNSSANVSRIDYRQENKRNLNNSSLKKRENLESNNSTNNTAQTVGVKLICDTPNEEIKKYFSKTVCYILKNRNFILMMIFLLNM
jgi:hypothetical protein